eukprot:41283-Pyramimonas_sp.AAC.1
MRCRPFGPLPMRSARVRRPRGLSSGGSGCRKILSKVGGACSGGPWNQRVGSPLGTAWMGPPLGPRTLGILSCRSGNRSVTRGGPPRLRARDLDVPLGEPPPAPTVEEVREALGKFKKNTAIGRCGWEPASLE